MTKLQITHSTNTLGKSKLFFYTETPPIQNAVGFLHFTFYIAVYRLQTDGHVSFIFSEPEGLADNLGAPSKM